MGKMDLRYLLVRKLYAFNMHCYLVYLKRRLAQLNYIILKLIQLMTNECIVSKNKVLVLQGKCYHPSMHNNKTDEGCTFHYLCFIQKTYGPAHFLSIQVPI